MRNSCPDRGSGGTLGETELLRAVPARGHGERRTDVLREAGLLGTFPEERFDRIVRLAARLTGVPMAMINLVGEQQWTRASHGIDGGVTPLVDSICRHAVDQGSRLEVPDLRRDDRFVENRFVTGSPGVRFYAAETLQVAGEPVGTLCVLDTRPRELSRDQHEVLGELAAWAEAELNNKALNDAAREAQQSDALTRAILQSAGDGIVASGPDGSVLLVNQAAADMLGWSPADLEGRTLHEVAHHTRPDGTTYPVTECPSHRAIDEGLSLPPHEDLFWRRTGEALPIEMTVTCLEDVTGHGGAVSVFRDISGRREVQRLKDEFVGVVSHELRTPLTSIVGSLKLLHAEVAAPLDERQRPLVDMALRNAQRLGTLVDDILDMDRLDAGRMPLRAVVVDAVDLARGVVEQLQGTAALEQAELVLDAPATGLLVRADPARLTQAVTNLVGNALKFTTGGRVRVGARRAGPEVRIEVADTGVGIAPEDIPLLFERFRQVGGADSGPRKGTGLGLAITKAIVEQSGGRIEVVSAVGEGSVFTVVLPAAEPGTAPKGGRDA
ncbi:PAS domain S-box protein [Kocuria sediminis]|uniref:histidine kinase n=1 Tax=Kocuria sediminis TaxID=1038857 RepID=A0A6N8GS50_9MICC|nr:PAS domain S-box protein [Kocuria sediminis]